jgi:hypothetical protein
VSVKTSLGSEPPSDGRITGGAPVVRSTERGEGGGGMIGRRGGGGEGRAILGHLDVAVAMGRQMRAQVIAEFLGFESRDMAQLHPGRGLGRDRVDRDGRDRRR